MWTGPSCARHTAPLMQAAPTVPRTCSRSLGVCSQQASAEYEALKLRQGMSQVAHESMSRSSELSVVSLPPPLNWELLSSAISPSHLPVVSSPLPPCDFPIDSTRARTSASESFVPDRHSEVIMLDSGISFGDLELSSAECALDSSPSLRSASPSHAYALQGNQAGEKWGSWMFFPE